jgi:hypothetical protein
VKAAEPLDDHDLSLADDLERSGDDHQRGECHNAEKDQACHSIPSCLAGEYAKKNAAVVFHGGVIVHRSYCFNAMF